MGTPGKAHSQRDEDVLARGTGVTKKMCRPGAVTEADSLVPEVWKNRAL